MTEGTAVRIRVLGPIGANDGDEDVALTPQLRRLLAVLVVADGEPVSADVLAERLGRGPADGSAIRTAVLRLRRVLGDRIDTTDAGYRLRLGADELDASVFAAQRIVPAGAPPTERIERLQHALALWRGPALGELADEEWARPLAVRLDEDHALTIEDLAAAYVEHGQAARAVALLEPHVVDHPYRERPVALLMRALAAGGRVADALRAFQRFRTILRDDIGIDPTPELRELEAELLAGSEPDTTAPAPPHDHLPDGTVTFLFTDIEGSTQRWHSDEASMSDAVAAHDATIGSVVSAHGGVVFKHTGDGACAVFTSAPAAIAAALAIQEQVALPVRIGIHTGEAERRGRDYFGPTLNRVARITDAAHGGQILVSSVTAGLAPRDDYVDHGEVRLKGLPTPEHVLQVGHGEFPPLRVVRERPGNLPDELTSFVGREREVAELSEALLDRRLVTLIGVGGTGKTRLAVEAAAALGPTFPDGCWLVELAPVAVPGAVPFAFASALSITLRADVDVVDAVADHLRHRRAIVVVDNCEHVLGAAADVIEQLVARCPSVTVLATSREPLMLRGEHLVPVPSLDGDDAERLFVERARAEDPHLELDADQIEAVRAVCARLDHLPLAIELAASRVRAFTPVELHSMLDERFRLLVGGRRSRMERHQTLRGTVDWSYDLCDETEQVVFDRLGVFAAAFDMADARAVAAGGTISELDVADAVPRLVDRSLVQRLTGPDGTTRYRLLETMRAYAREHLHQRDELDDAWRRYATHIATTIGHMAVHSLGPDERRTMRRLLEYLPDALVAMDWLAEHHEWNLAARVPTLFIADGRAGLELYGRLHAAMFASGEEPPELDAIRRSDMATVMKQSEEALSVAAWERVRAGDEQSATDWFVMPAVVMAQPSTASEAMELLHALRRYETAPPLTRLSATHFALRRILNSAVDLADIDGLDAAIDDLARFAETIDSDTVRSGVADLRALAASRTQRWRDAAETFAEAIRLTEPKNDWFAVATGWNELIAWALAEEPVQLGRLLDQWAILEGGAVHILRPRGALASALTLRARGHRELADRWMWWLVSQDSDAELLRLFSTQLGPYADLDPADAPAIVDTFEALHAELRLAAFQ